VIRWWSTDAAVCRKWCSRNYHQQYNHSTDVNTWQRLWQDAETDPRSKFICVIGAGDKVEQCCEWVWRWMRHTSLFRAYQSVSTASQQLSTTVHHSISGKIMQLKVDQRNWAKCGTDNLNTMEIILHPKWRTAKTEIYLNTTQQKHISLDLYWLLCIFIQTVCFSTTYTN